MKDVNQNQQQNQCASNASSNNRNFFFFFFEIVKNLFSFQSETIFFILLNINKGCFNKIPITPQIHANKAVSRKKKQIFKILNIDFIFSKKERFIIYTSNRANEMIRSSPCSNNTKELFYFNWIKCFFFQSLNGTERNFTRKQQNKNFEEKKKQMKTLNELKLTKLMHNTMNKINGVPSWGNSMLPVPPPPPPVPTLDSKKYLTNQKIIRLKKIFERFFSNLKFFSYLIEWKEKFVRFIIKIRKIT